MSDPERRESDSSEKKNFRPEDEASYYLGDNFELGGVRFGNEDVSQGEEEEKQRNLSRFGKEVWNEKDQLGADSKAEKHPSDHSILEEVKASLHATPQRDASDIEVEVTGGVVWLRGFANTREDKREFQNRVERLSSVRDVMNLISIRSIL